MQSLENNLKIEEENFFIKILELSKPHMIDWLCRTVKAFEAAPEDLCYKRMLNWLLIYDNRLGLNLKILF